MRLIDAIKSFPVLDKGEVASEILAKRLLDEVPESLSVLRDLLGAHDLGQKLIAGVLRYSPYLGGLMRNDPQGLYETLVTPLDQRKSALRQRVRDAVLKGGDDDEIGRVLRIYANHIALLTALADIAGAWPLDMVTGTLTDCADDTVQLALLHLFRDACENGQILHDFTPELVTTSGYFILGMGKLGAGELNYSSDIDLIVFFDPDRSPFKAGREPQPAFVRMTQRLTKLLHERTAEGYVFRVDLRLRPDPGSTAIAISVPSALHYYETIGQTWERSALIKARVIAGDETAGQAFLREVSPFIWRKYLDYSAVADVHAMKRQIHAFRGHDVIALEGHNVKLGRGGIREIEFFVQTQQLIAAGRNPQLRTRETLEGLERLVEAKWVQPDTARDLHAAYLFLRGVEHRLQMIADEQTHSLPEDRQQIADFSRFMGFADRDAFEKTFFSHARKVESAYAHLFEEVKPLAKLEGVIDLFAAPPKPSTVVALEKLGFSEPIAALETVQSWGTSRINALKSQFVRDKLFELAPALIEAFSRCGDADRGLRGFDRFVTTSNQPLELLTLLRTHPDLLDLVCAIFATAPRLSETIARRVHVADALVDPAFFGELPNAEQLRDKLATAVDHARDYEDVLDRVRIFGQEQIFLTGIRILSGTLSPVQAGDIFSRIADTIIETLFSVVQGVIRQAHGDFPGMRMAVVALGKLGSREMTSSSDLDLVLLYDHHEDAIMSDGARPLAASHYFARFTQRLISALSAPTSEGVLYEVDLRLRPSGRSGPVASHIQSFREYQASEAWTWEHMALTRARVVVASDGFAAPVDEAICEIFQRDRSRVTVVADVADMRGAIAEERGDAEAFDIKNAAGGLIDVEFIAQTLQLLHAKAHPAILAVNTGAVIEQAGSLGLLLPEDYEVLLRAYRLYSSLTQMLRLCLSQSFSTQTASIGLKRLLARAGDMPDFSTLEADLVATEKQVRAIFKRLMSKRG